MERARSNWQTLVRDRNHSWNLGLPSVCAGSCAGSKRNLWRGRIWNRRNVSCPASGFNPSGGEWAGLVVFRLDPDAKVEHYNSSLARGNRSNIHDHRVCHPSSISMLAPPSHRFLFLRETNHEARYRKPSSLLSSRARRPLPLRRQSIPSARRRLATCCLRLGLLCR